MENNQLAITFRHITEHDISKIIKLQKISFPRMAKKGEIWEEDEIKKYVKVFPEGQFCAELNGRIVGSASSLIINLNPPYRSHTWYEICYDDIEKYHNVNSDTLYDVDISVLPEFRHMGIASRLYYIRKELVRKLNLKRMIGGGRLSNYHKYCHVMSANEYLENVKKLILKEPALNCQLKNGFKIVKIMPNYLPDEDSLDYAAFIEWKNPSTHIPDRHQVNQTLI